MLDMQTKIRRRGHGDVPTWTSRGGRWTALALLGAAGVAGCGGAGSSSDAQPDAAVDAGACADGPERNGPYTRVVVAGEDDALGIIDPSVEYAATASSGLMSYTAVPGFSQVHIAVAVSDDRGASWRHVSDVTEPRPITISTGDDDVCGAATCEGTLVQESSSLILDPFDPDPSRRLKVFAHSYFFGTERQLELGYIALYTAPVAEGPWTKRRCWAGHRRQPSRTRPLLTTSRPIRPSESCGTV